MRTAKKNFENASLAGAAMLWLTVVGGCMQGTPVSPSASEMAETKAIVKHDVIPFTLSAPALSGPIQRGSSAAVTIAIRRTGTFDEDVTVAFSEVPQGVAIEPAMPTIHHGNSDVKVTITADAGAALGKFNVKLTGKPSKGAVANAELKLTIEPKDTFTLSIPDVPTLKQGKSLNVSIKIARDKTFGQDVELTFGKLPTGVTLEPKSTVIRRSENNTQVKLVAASDAALGNFSVKVTGRPSHGADASQEFGVTVAK